MTFKNRAEMDAKAWEIMHARKVSLGAPMGFALCGRPATYGELGAMIAAGAEFEHAWSEFLHEFCRFKSASFFAEEPPTNLSPGFRAWLAGAAEFMCGEFNLLPVPEWTELPEYFLQEEYDPGSELFPYYVAQGELRDRLRDRCDKAFLRRNVLFESRGLITL